MEHTWSTLGAPLERSSGCFIPKGIQFVCAPQAVWMKTGGGGDDWKICLQTSLRISARLAR